MQELTRVRHDPSESEHEDGPDPLGIDMAHWLAEAMRAMCFARALDAKLWRLSRQGRVGVYTPMRGQEATQIGAGLALRQHDWLVPNFRDIGLLSVRRIPLERLLLYWMGFEEANLHDDRTLPIAAPVGSHLPHAAGLAWAEKLREGSGAVLVSFGDGATSTGDFHEAMNLASVRRLPVVFLCQNNGWALSTPLSEQTGQTMLSRKALAYGFSGVRVDGQDVEAVHRVVGRALEQARAGCGPVLVEALTCRDGAHSTADDPSRYRAAQEGAAPDPIALCRDRLASADAWSATEERAMEQVHERRIRHGVAVAEKLATELAADPAPVFSHVYARAPVQLHRQQAAVAAVTGPSTGIHGGTGVQMDESRAGTAPVQWPCATGPTRELNLVQALRMGLDEELARDRDVLLMGQDIGRLGGTFRVTEGLLDRYGADRVCDTPICESGMVGAAIGMAWSGLRPVCEMQFAGFIYPAFDQLRSHASRIRSRTRGRHRAALVIRAPYGSGVGAPESHSDSIEMLLARTPGLVVVVPSGPRAARALIKAAIRSDDPVVFLEPMSIYRSVTEAVPVQEEVATLGGTVRVRAGDDVTLVGYGAMLQRCLEAAKALEQRHGVQAEVLDLTTIAPLDERPIVASARRTGALVVVQEGARLGDIGAEIASRMLEQGGPRDAVPFRRVTGCDVPPPFPGRAHVVWPDVARIVHAAEEVLGLSTSARRANSPVMRSPAA